MNSQFRRPVDELGWNVHFKGTLSRTEEAWISEFENIPIWLAKRYNDDIFAFSRESRSLWERWIQDDPELFQASVLREGILRLYSDPARFAALTAAIEKARRERDEAEHRWLELAEKVEALTESVPPVW